MLKEPVMLLYLSGEMSEHRIKAWSEKIKDEFKQLSAVSHVDILGARGYEIGIEVSEERLREYGLTFNMVKRCDQTQQPESCMRDHPDPGRRDSGANHGA